MQARYTGWPDVQHPYKRNPDGSYEFIGLGEFNSSKRKRLAGAWGQDQARL